MSKYFVGSLNSKPIHVQFGDSFLLTSSNEFDQINSFDDFDKVVKFLQQSPVVEAVVPGVGPKTLAAINKAEQEYWENRNPAPVVEPAPVVALTEKQVALNLVREYRVVINEVLAKVKSNPLYAQVKAEFKKVFGDRFKTFFVKVQSELNG
jgi:hypothetical protein